MHPDPETHTHNHAIPTTPTTQHPIDFFRRRMCSKLKKILRLVLTETPKTHTEALARCKSSRLSSRCTHAGAVVNGATGPGV
jgi:hypothetical protein